MSLFVAIRPAVVAIDHLSTTLESVQASEAGRRLHWQPADRWHVTLAFLGEVDESTITRMTGRLEALGSSRPAPGPLHLAGAGVFSGEVLWVGVTGLEPPADADLASLAAAVRSAASREHVPVDHRHWRSHLTVARDRQRDPHTDGLSDALTVAAQLESYAGPAWFVDEVQLVESTGGPHPVHTVLHRTSLDRAPQ